MKTVETWYEGIYSQYKELPWLHELLSRCACPVMPWRVLGVVPFGYIVFISAEGKSFKMLNHPVIFYGDTIE